MAKRTSTKRRKKERSTKHTHKTKDLVTRAPLKPEWTQVLRKGSGTRRVYLVTTPVISHE